MNEKSGENEARRVKGCRTVVRFARHVAGLTQPPLLNPPPLPLLRWSSFLVVYPGLFRVPRCAAALSSPPLRRPLRAARYFSINNNLQRAERRYSVSVLVATEPPPAPTQR